jgi:hypothetical protein
MSEETEMDDVLVALRDVGMDEPRHDEVDARVRAALAQEIDREQRGPGRRRWLRRRPPMRVALPLAVLLTGGLGAVGYAALSSPARLSSGIECHEDTSLGGSGAIVGVDGRSAIDTCAALWADGKLGRGTTAAPARLHACVDPNGGGAVHVFASADAGICGEVGLSESPAAGTSADARRYARFSQGLLARLDKVACPTPQQARTLVRESLDASGLSGWTTVDAGGYNTELPCASLALDSDARVATISPVGR